MEIMVQTSKTVKPANGGGGVVSAAAANAVAVPLTVIDNVTHDSHISGINLFHPPTPSNAILEAGLAAALARYREWAGRLGVDARGRRAILLSDAGARFVEATADVALTAAVLEPAAPETRMLHPSGDGAKELALVHVTRFACGSVAVGHTVHHAVGDGRAICNFLLAWGQATRGAPIVPAPVHDRASLFVPRCPPRVEFDHRAAEFKPPPGDGESKAAGRSSAADHDDEVVVQRVSFSQEFITELKSLARTYNSTFQCVAAHLWQCITKARGLDGDEVTTLRVAVDGRARMRHPRVPEGYAANTVLSALAATTTGELLASPLPRVTELIARAVARIDDAYFRSFVDFASSGAAESDQLVPADDAEEGSTDVEVNSLLRIPFHDLDFGSGPSFFFMPSSSYLPEEGCAFVVRSFRGDHGSVDAYVPLSRRAMAGFNTCCYSLPAADAQLC